MIFISLFCFLVGCINLPCIFGEQLTSQAESGYVNVIALVICWGLAVGMLFVKF